MHVQTDFWAAYFSSLPLLLFLTLHFGDITHSENPCRYDDVVLVEHKTGSVQVVSGTPSLSPCDDTTCGHIWPRPQCGALEQLSVVGMTDRVSRVRPPARSMQSRAWYEPPQSLKLYNHEEVRIESSQFHIDHMWVNACLAFSVLIVYNVKARRRP